MSPDARSTRIVERFPLIDGTRTRILEVTGEGPTVVFLHGFTDSADCWRPVLGNLAGAGRHAVAVDLPGHGRSSRPRTLSLRDMDPFVDAVVDRYSRASPVVLVGNSLGGYLALRAAARPDPPLLAVAALGTAGLAYKPAFELSVAILRRLHAPLRLLDVLPVPPAVARRLARMTYLRLTSGRADASLVNAYASHFRGVHALGRARGYLVTLSREIDAQPLALPEIRVPVLLVWGRRDGLTDPAGAPALLNVVRESRLVLLDEAGHCPQLDLPAKVARLVAGLPSSATRGDS